MKIYKIDAAKKKKTEIRERHDKLGQEYTDIDTFIKDLLKEKREINKNRNCFKWIYRLLFF